jgi:hypothetical protein
MAWGIGLSMGAALYATAQKAEHPLLCVFKTPDHSAKILSQNHIPSFAIHLLDLHQGAFERAPSRYDSDNAIADWTGPLLSMRDILVWEHEIYLLDKSGTLFRVKVEGLEEDSQHNFQLLERGTWSLLTNLQHETLISLHTYCYREHRYLFAHTQDALSHRFRYIILSQSGSEGQELADFTPQARVGHRVFTDLCGEAFYILHGNGGRIDRILLASLHEKR